MDMHSTIVIDVLRAYNAFYDFKISRQVNYKNDLRDLHIYYTFKQIFLSGQLILTIFIAC